MVGMLQSPVDDPVGHRNKWNGLIEIQWVHGSKGLRVNIQLGTVKGVTPPHPMRVRRNVRQEFTEGGMV